MKIPSIDRRAWTRGGTYLLLALAIHVPVIGGLWIALGHVTLPKPREVVVVELIPRAPAVTPDGQATQPAPSLPTTTATSRQGGPSR